MIRPALGERLLGYDIDGEALSLARYHAEQAGVEGDIHWQQRPFTDLRAKAEYGCLITNPPYGQRMGDDAKIEQLYRTFPLVLRRLPTWSHYILSARRDLESLVGQQADRRRKLYNGPLECTYYQFHGPRPQPSPPRYSGEVKPPLPAARVIAPAFGGTKTRSTWPSSPVRTIARPPSTPTGST
jgi:putative N6-adenine-specific DNA methylase